MSRDIRPGSPERTHHHLHLSGREAIGVARRVAALKPCLVHAHAAEVVTVWELSGPVVVFRSGLSDSKTAPADESELLADHPLTDRSLSG
jgi:hypothetical protein